MAFKISTGGKIRRVKKCPTCLLTLVELSAPSCRPCMFAKKRADVIAASTFASFDGIPCRSITLTKGYVAWVDEARFDELARWKWQADVHVRKGKVYAYRRLNDEERTAYGCATIRMHRQIKGDPDGMTVDHRDGNGLHNWEANLRVATTEQNNQNKRMRKAPISGLTGAYYDKRRGTFYANIGYKGKTIHIGTFGTPEEAAEAYRLKTLELHGEFSHVHIIEPVKEP